MYSSATIQSIGNAMFGLDFILISDHYYVEHTAEIGSGSLSINYQILVGKMEIYALY